MQSTNTMSIVIVASWKLIPFHYKWLILHKFIKQIFFQVEDQVSSVFVA